MDALTFITAQSLTFSYSGGSYAVSNGTVEGCGATLDEALAALMASLVDTRALLSAPLDAYTAVDGASVAVCEAHNAGTLVAKPAPVEELPAEEVVE